MATPAATAGYGAVNAVTYITGTTHTKMLWPESSIPSTFTVCSVTRYHGTARQRILSCDFAPTQPLNWLHGHHGGVRGKAYYNVFPAMGAGDGRGLNDWLVMCGTNDAGVPTPGNIVMDQIGTGTVNGGQGGCRLHMGYVPKTSDWAFHSLFIWDYSLGTVPIPWHMRPCLCKLVILTVPFL